MHSIQLLIVIAILLLVECDELLLLQAIWRHGDRSPIQSCKGYPIQTQHWPQGKGQLTAEGMAQQVKLGKIIYNRYVDSLNFLSPYYDAHQIYVRSTDVNRTLMSAMANFIGFYNNPSQNERIGIDFPNATEWPRGFVAVPIHTVADETDYIGNPDANCPRQEWLSKMVQQTPEWKNLTKNYMKMHAFTTPVSSLLYDQLEQLNNEIQNYENGLNLQPFEEIDFKHEIGKIRGGSILWSMLNHFDLKLHCLKSENFESANCTWMKDLKYYAYSAHDTTLAALMCTLDAKHKILINGGYPKYSAAMFFELWNTTNGPGLKVYYHRDFTEDQLEDVTDLLDHCSEHMDSNGFCNYEKFRTNGIVYYPGNEDELCQDTKSKRTSFNPDEYETKATSTVTLAPVAFILLLLQVIIS
ncbi:Histidine phosphatase (branch 2) family protein [Brugia pahangi]